MNNNRKYDIAIVGGGLAGLSAAIACSKSGYSVILFEKETYPFHKVCGEYVSLESVPFLKHLGLSLENLPQISQLELSSPNGNLITQKLPLGGIGISRYKMDAELAGIARANNVSVSEGNRVQDIRFEKEQFTIFSDSLEPVMAGICCGAFGKRSNLDVKWKRPFVQKKPGPLNNFIGVKYHMHIDHPREVIALHNFHGGYCGMSSIEEGKTCLCYLTAAQNLQSNGNNIQQMERNLLSGNPFLHQVFEKAHSLYEKPLTISQISFDKKEQVVHRVLMLGDAAGMITPLCGNGMSMALQSGRIASALIIRFLSGEINRATMENKYKEDWNAAFNSRLFAGRIIQALFGKEWLTNGVVGLLKPFPAIVKRIIRQTHGSAP